jgi:hypothetical protein
MSRHTVAQAADMLGITTGAVRNRLARDTLHNVKEGGTVYVLLPTDMSRDAGRDTDDTPGGTPEVSEAAGDDLLHRQMQARIDDLREQLQAERRANEENRRIIVALTSRIPQLEAPQETTESRETVEEPQQAPPAPARPARPSDGRAEALVA